MPHDDRSPTADLTRRQLLRGAAATGALGALPTLSGPPAFAQVGGGSKGGGYGERASGAGGATPVASRSRAGSHIGAI